MVVIMMGRILNTAEGQVDRRLLLALFAASVRSALPASWCIDPAIFDELLVALTLAGASRAPRLHAAMRS